MNCKKMMMLSFSLSICLTIEAVVYEPFADTDNTLPSDKSFEDNFGYNNPFTSSQQRTIGGGAVDYCPYCGAALDPYDHTELVRHGNSNGNAYDDTGIPHNCQVSLDGEEVLLWLAALLIVARCTRALWRKRMAKHAQGH